MREQFAELKDREAEILADLPETDSESLLRIRELLVTDRQAATLSLPAASRVSIRTPDGVARGT